MVWKERKMESLAFYFDSTSDDDDDDNDDDDDVDGSFHDLLLISRTT